MIKFTAFALCATLFGLVGGQAFAQQVPLMAPDDPRVRYVTYRADRSVAIKVRRGVVTRLILERDESIKLSGAGFPSRCVSEADEWCIRAEKGESQVWIKPKTGATHNNLELATDKRDYSIKLEVLPDAPKGEAPPDEIFRVIFVYPASDRAGPHGGAAARRTSSVDEEPGSAPAGAGAALPVTASGNLADLGCSQPRRVVNAQYSRDAGQQALAPARVFDDGAHTVFVFGDTATMPAVFAVAPDKSESRVNFSVDGNCLVVHQLGAEFVLRAGSAELHVFNDAFVPGATSLPLRAMRERREVQQ